MQTLSILGGDNAPPPIVPEAPAAEPKQAFRYAFLALLAFNVFIVSGGAAFAVLYFTR